MRRLALICALLPLPALAQSEDEGRLVQFIEGALSDGAARSVDLQGFEGALSSQATLDRLTIADADGVWLEIEGAVLDWNRAAVLRGEIAIRTISAETVTLYRLPQAEESTPAPEATAFSLPDLPVSIAIEAAEITRLELGAPVLGSALTATASAQVSLAGGAGEATLDFERVDGQTGEIALSASYDNATTEVALSLLAREGAGGIAATMLQIDGAPPLALEIEGAGPLDAFDATYALATDGVDRLSGEASISESETGATQVVFQLGGDLTPVVSGGLETFLGTDAAMSAEANLNPDGTITLDAFTVQSAALDLSGSLYLDAERAPIAFDLAGDVRPPDGADRLTLPGSATEIEAATLSVAFDRRNSNAVAANAALTGLTAQGFSAPETQVTLDGTLDGTQFAGRLEAESDGLSHSDPAIAEALGPQVGLATDIDWTADGVLTLTGITLRTDAAALAGDVSIRPGESELQVGAAFDLSIRDLRPFGPLAGQQLGGSTTARLNLDLEALSGAFETVFSAEALDLSVPDLFQDGLLAGETTLNGRIARDESGLTVDGFELNGQALGLTVSGAVTSSATDMAFSAELADAALADPRLSGPASVSGQITRGDTTTPYRLSDLDIASDLVELGGTITALPGDETFPLTADLNGRADLATWQAITGQSLGGTLAFTLSGDGDLRTETVSGAVTATGNGLRIASVPTALLAGQTEMIGQIVVADGTISLDPLSINGRELTATLNGQISSLDSDLTLTGRLRDGRILSSALPGALSLDAEVSQTGGSPISVAATARGPAGLRAEITGTATMEPQLDLQITGAVPLALADPFIAPQTLSGRAGLDLRLRGAPAIDALSGRVSIGDARLGLPLQGLALQSINSRIDIANGTGSLDLAGALSSGGALGISGRVGLTGSNPVDLDIRLDQARLVDPALYDAIIETVRLNLSGALSAQQFLSGDVNLGVVELRVPETSIGGAGAIPDIRHVGETAVERQTRVYAGLLDTGGSGGSGLSRLGLDIGILAPGRIFLRGRGLDAELGGTVRLNGTAAAVIPSGQFELIRGRLSILGQRLDLTDGSVTLQGAAPYLSLTAETDAGDYTIFITVEGEATAPTVSFRSSPDLPEDEVLAQLFFGRSVSSLSAVQALQLADGVASLAGGGSGVFTRLRDNLGLDDLDVSTDEAGNAAVTAGRYISENVYTDLTIDDGGTGVSINIDLTPSITARGGVESDGSSSIGVFFERDY